MSANLPSNRAFGWLFAVVFTLIALYSLPGEGPMAAWMLAAAAACVAVTVARPQWLGPLNRAWMGFGGLLHRLVSPLVLGVIYYGVFTPFGLVMRMSGRDSLKRRLEPAARTYWVEREPPGPAPGSFRDQF